eukprot:TRINITY_DN3325_c0_g2_i1.p1 TRINITY_DN3325_c0_g2~~TRINITY_DN3325_c0_g2_i1.p1  ORF type:complete len:158 (-),score=49.23 TRINITY_DN3325_c0_g2_i1:267-740(-)
MKGILKGKVDKDLPHPPPSGSTTATSSTSSGSGVTSPVLEERSDRYTVYITNETDNYFLMPASLTAEEVSQLLSNDAEDEEEISENKDSTIKPLSEENINTTPTSTHTNNSSPNSSPTQPISESNSNSPPIRQSRPTRLSIDYLKKEEKHVVSRFRY